METFSMMGGACCFIVVIPTWLVIAIFAKIPNKVKVIVTVLLLLPFCIAGLSVWKNSRDEDLVSACYDGDIAKIKSLLASGASPNREVEFGYPICAALSNQHHEAAKVLISAGADPNTICEGATPLQIAAARKDWELVRFLKANGAKR